MRHRIAYGLLSALSAVFCASCTSVPDLQVSAPTVKDVIRDVQCQIRAAFSAQNLPAKRRTPGVTAAVDLTLQVDDSVGVNPTVSFIDPLNAAGTSFSFGGSALLKGERQRIYTESFVVKNVYAAGPVCANQKELLLNGDLGIKETVALGLKSIDGAPNLSFGEDSAFGQTIQFTVTKNVSGIGPTWTLAKFTGPGGLFGAERADLHKLSISFSQSTDTAKQQNQKMLLQSILPNLRLRQ